jgi:hypothetical protein
MTRFNDLLNGIKNTIATEANKKKLGLSKSQSAMPFKLGDKVVNTNTACMHYGSKGSVCGLESLPDNMGEIVAYQTTNAGETWKVGDILKKTPNQLSFDNDETSYEMPMTMSEDDEMEMEDEDEDEMEIEESEMTEYKEEFFEMSVGSLRAIMQHSQAILDALDNPMVKENLTESWLQGKIAITEDYMRTIHDFIMFVSEAADNISAADKPGLWDNIRKKKERMGKKYRPAKPGDKDRPDTKQWKKLTDGK